MRNTGLEGHAQIGDKVQITRDNIIVQHTVMETCEDGCIIVLELQDQVVEPSEYEILERAPEIRKVPFAILWFLFSEKEEKDYVLQMSKSMKEFCGDPEDLYSIYDKDGDKDFEEAIPANPGFYKIIGYCCHEERVRANSYIVSEYLSDFSFKKITENQALTFNAEKEAEKLGRGE